MVDALAQDILSLIIFGLALSQNSASSSYFAQIILKILSFCGVFIAFFSQEVLGQDDIGCFVDGECLQSPYFGIGNTITQQECLQ